MSNIVPSFLKSKNNLLNSRNINNINISKNFSSKINSQNTFVYKRTK